MGTVAEVIIFVMWPIGFLQDLMEARDRRRARKDAEAAFHERRQKMGSR